MSNNHSSSTVISGLVFSMDAANKKSYVGPPIKNNPTGISFAGVTTGTGYVCTGITEVIDIPQLGPTTVYTSNIQNNYPTSGNCCPSLFQYGGYAVTGSTLYTYGIVYRCQSGYTHPNFMYRYEYNGATYVTESGVHDNAKRIHLGNGWYWAWNTFTTQPTTTQINSSGLWFYNYSTFSDKISVAKVFVTQGDYTGLHPKYWPAFNTTRSNTQAIVDPIGNNTITATSLTYASDGTFSFNNSTDYISVPVITDSMLNSGSWTLSSFVKFTSVNKGADNAIAGHGSAAGSSGLHLGERSALPYFGLYANDLSGTKPLAANTWYEISYIFDYTTKLKTIYVNGVYDTSGGSVGYSGAGSNFEIGRYPWSTGYKLHGLADIVRFYNRALSASEVAQNFNALRGRYSL